MPIRSLSFCNLVAIWFETLLYGVYVVFLVPTVDVLLFRPLSTRYPLGSGPKFKQAYLAAIFALWTFSTVHVAAGLMMLLEAFVLFPDVSSESYFSKITSPLNVLRVTAFLASIAVADALMIHRVYILWYRSATVVLIPLFSLGLLIVSGITVVTFSSQVPNPPPFLPSSSASIGLSSLLTPTLRILVPVHVAMSFITNSWISILAGIKLWREGDFIEGEESWSYRRQIIVTIGETGLVYPLTALIALLLSIAGTNGQIIPFTALTPLAAIIPTFMILAVELGYTTCPPNSAVGRYPRDRSDSLMVSSITPFEKANTTPTPVTTPMTRMVTPPVLCQPSSAQVAYYKPREEFVFKSEPTTPLSLGSPALRNMRLPPVPSTPPPIPSSIGTRRRLREVPIPPLKLFREDRPDSPPPAPHTPTPRTQLPSPFEAHFPRNGRHERVSQQTFNPRRGSAGNGGTAYTTFGNSSLARMLVIAKEGGEKLPLASTPEITGSGNGNKSQEREKKDKGKKPMVAKRDLPPGVYMTKAVERKIDYIDEESA